MDLNQLRELLDLVREHDLAEFEIEHEGLRLKVRKDGVGVLHAAPAVPAVVVPALPGPPAAAAPPSPPAPPVPVPTPGEDTDGDVEFAVVKSPIVGTFYRASEPGAAAFVDVGTTVKKGQVLCIIEAMKLMNEIDSEYDGEVVNIYVENGQPVQYGERLFAIRTM